MKVTQGSASAGQHLTLRHVLVLVTGAMISFAPAALVFNVWSIFVVPVCDEFNIATNQFALYITIIFVTAAIASPFIGNLMDRIDLRIIGTAAVGLCALGLFLGGFWIRVEGFYVSGLIEGLGIIVLNFLIIPTLINRWFTIRTGFLIGVCMAMTGVGGAVWAAVGGALISGYGWRFTYEVFGGIAALVMLLTAFGIRSYPEHVGLAPYGNKGADAALVSSDGMTTGSKPAATNASGAASDVLHRGVPAKAAFGSGAFVLLCVMAGLFNFCCQGGGYFPTYLYALNDAGTLDLGDNAVLAASVATSCLMASAAVCKVAIGALSDRSVPAAVTFCGLGGIAGMALCWVCPMSVTAVYAGAACYGLAFAGIDVLAPAMGRHLFGPREYTHIYSRVTSCTTLAAAVGATGLATLLDVSWAALFGVCIALLAVATIAGLDALKASRKLVWTEE